MDELCQHRLYLYRQEDREQASSTEVIPNLARTGQGQETDAGERRSLNHNLSRAASSSL